MIIEGRTKTCTICSFVEFAWKSPEKTKSRNRVGLTQSWSIPAKSGFWIWVCHGIPRPSMCTFKIVFYSINFTGFYNFCRRIWKIHVIISGIYRWFSRRTKPPFRSGMFHCQPLLRTPDGTIEGTCSYTKTWYPNFMAYMAISKVMGAPLNHQFYFRIFHELTIQRAWRSPVTLAPPTCSSRHWQPPNPQHVFFGSIAAPTASSAGAMSCGWWQGSSRSAFKVAEGPGCNPQKTTWIFPKLTQKSENPTDCSLFCL